jgi:hypothetical protein
VNPRGVHRCFPYWVVLVVLVVPLVFWMLTSKVWGWSGVRPLTARSH